MKRRTFAISERHILALNLLCYLPVLLEPRLTAGIVGYMARTYSPALPFFFGIWALVGVIYLFRFKAKPVAFIVCGFPIISHWGMGLAWWLSDLEHVPIGVFFLPLAIFININWLIHTRLRAMAKGESLDDTILPPNAD